MPGKHLDESKRECVRKLHEYFQKELANGGPLLPLNAIQETTISSPVQEPPSPFETFKDVMLKNEEIDSLNEPLLNLHNSNPDFTSICWAESLIITENKHTKNQTISKAYSILLDAPGNIQDLPGESENTSCYEVLEQTAKKTLNFTTVKETEDYLIKEHKTLFCGAGPVLSHHFIVWPKLKRKQIEISINPLGASKLKNCSEIKNGNHLESRDDNEDGDLINLRKSGGDNEVSEENSSTRPMTAEFEKPPAALGSEENNNLEEEVDKEASTKNIGAMHGPEEASTRSLPKHDEIANIIPEKKSSKERRRSSSNKVKNSLLVRNVNCSVDNLGICQEMIEKSKNFIGQSNSSKVTLGKWFFPDSTLAGPLDKDRSFMLKVKVIVNLKKQHMSNSQESGEEEEKGNKGETELVVEEDCLYVVPRIKPATR